MSGARRPPPALRASGLVRRFGPTLALDDVYLDIPEGQVASLVGPSGCGKSTLLRTLLWLDAPDEGFVEVAGGYIGREILPGGLIRRQSRREIDRIRPRIGMVYQDLNLWPHMSVRDNVLRPQVVAIRRDPADAAARTDALLERLGIADLAGSFPSGISGGQKQRVAIARALAMEPRIMLFDEPTSALDPELIGEVLKLLRELAQEGMTMLVVTHELAFARDVASRLLFMDRGRIIADGDPRSVIGSRDDPRVAAFFDRVAAFHPAIGGPADRATEHTP